MSTTNRTHTLKAGKVYPLDSVYDILGLIPKDCYDQDDPASESGDAGETIRMKKNVTIKIQVRTDGKD